MQDQDLTHSTRRSDNMNFIIRFFALTDHGDHLDDLGAGARDDGWLHGFILF
ncbi:hypothetical protein [Methanolobus sp.]|uniref:hypothetical protein n=1 Tax=Methanolobus sp. TaxID=1874737 RepID=UPI002587D096|nr:hypothetical protein [Methanolobus sp.]